MTSDDDVDSTATASPSKADAISGNNTPRGISSSPRRGATLHSLLHVRSEHHSPFLRKQAVTLSHNSPAPFMAKHARSHSEAGLIGSTTRNKEKRGSLSSISELAPSLPSLKDGVVSSSAPRPVSLSDMREIDPLSSQSLFVSQGGYLAEEEGDVLQPKSVSPLSSASGRVTESLTELTATGPSTADMHTNTLTHSDDTNSMDFSEVSDIGSTPPDSHRGAHSSLSLFDDLISTSQAPSSWSGDKDAFSTIPLSPATTYTLPLTPTSSLENLEGVSVGGGTPSSSRRRKLLFTDEDDFSSPGPALRTASSSSSSSLFPDMDEKVNQSAGEESTEVNATTMSSTTQDPSLTAAGPNEAAVVVPKIAVPVEDVLLDLSPAALSVPLTPAPPPSATTPGRDITVVDGLASVLLHAEGCRLITVKLTAVLLKELVCEQSVVANLTMTQKTAIQVHKL